MSLYASSGVDYEILDEGKRVALAAALATNSFSLSRGAVGLDTSRGEPAFVFEFDNRHMAFVMECLGTKSTIARQYQEATGVNRFANIAYDSVAAIVNDIICVGALPLVVNAYFATGSPEWYRTEGRFEKLVEGWHDACKDAGATWGGGESPGLSGIVHDTEIDLAGSAVGAVAQGRDPILGQQLAVGDEIVLIASYGLHANGASLVRKVAGQLQKGYLTELSDGRQFGDAVLDRSAIYVPLMETLLGDDAGISYVSHITGHGFRKLMRADSEFTYRINQLPDVPEVLRFLVDQTRMSPSEAYGTFNMGAGLALYCRPEFAQPVLDAAAKLGLAAWRAGRVEAGPRQVIIEPLDVTYTSGDLNLR